VSLSLLLAHAPAADAAKGGGRSYSSGGRSYSSGGPSGGKSYTAGGSGGKSFSPAGGGSGGKSYSARGSSSGGNSSSSGGGRNYSPAGGGGGKSYSSGGGSSGGKTTYASPGGKSYSSGNNSTGAAVTSQKPAATSYDKLPAAEQKKAESRVAYQKAQQPRTTYTPPKGDPKPIDLRDKQIGRLRSELDHERWVNRDQRERTFYTTYYMRPLVVYNDPYNSFFWLWLLDRSADERAYWAYHHSYDMDRARYQELLTRDAQLEARIRELEQKKVPRDPTYTPPALKDNTDLMYADDYVDAVYNPQPVPAASPDRSYSSRSSGDGSVIGRVFFWMFLILLIGAFIALCVWLVFYKRWNV